MSKKIERYNPKTQSVEVWNPKSEYWSVDRKMPLEEAKKYFGNGGIIDRGQIVLKESARLVDAYRGLGLDQKSAQLAAGVETAVVSGDKTALVESFKLMGMTEAQAIEAAEKAVK